MPPAFLVLQHADAEAPGLLGPALEAAGFVLRTVRPDRGEAVPGAASEFAGLLLMGGPMGVYERGRFPHLRNEIDLVREALDREVPVLGICLGSQILAAAAGARVHRGPAKEIGWAPIRLRPAGAADPVLGLIPDGAFVFHWHGDTFELPSGAVLLASSDLYAHQAFRLGRAAYGLQFHPEVTEEMVREFAASGRVELEAERGPEGERLLVDGAGRHAAGLAPIVPCLVRAFLGAAGLPQGGPSARSSIAR
jgi:GMP synthase (glutamine-hydrolysing)